MDYFGGVEAGGTKFVCAIGTGDGKIMKKTTFPTGLPAETIGKAIDFLKDERFPLTAVGIGSFGPLDLHRNSPTYGMITKTPKKHWQFVDLIKPFGQALGIPVVLDTDVNAAAFGEAVWGGADKLESLIYLTVGTGIGGGAVVNGRLLHGLVHPEMGHIRIPRHPEDKDFAGICPFHGDCLEGMASGASMAARWGVSAETIPANHLAWDIEAHYIAAGIADLICVLSPERVVLGGGVMKHPGLLDQIRKRTLNFLNGYIYSETITERIETFIVQPALGDQVGVLGSIALAVKQIDF